MSALEFRLEDYTRSETAARRGIENRPLPYQVANLRLLHEHIIAPLQDLVQPFQVVITSGFRCWELNAAIGSGRTSQHLQGEAADLVVPGLELRKVYNVISTALPFDQLIYEFGSWIHVSYRPDRQRHDRRIARRVERPDGGANIVYEPAGEIL